MSFHDLQKYSNEPSDKELRKNRDRANNMTIFDLFSKPLSELDIFEPFGNITKRFTQYDNFKIDVKDENDKYVVEADLPGTKKEDITLDFNDGVLSIRAVHHENKEEGDANKYLLRERTVGQYERQIALEDVDENSINASFTDGILQITLPKVKKETKRKITIN